MPDDAWRDKLVGARMAVDSDFAQRVEQSSFSRQQWSLIMTAVEFEIQHPSDPDKAELVANTDELPAILPELDSIEEQMQAMGGGHQSKQGSGLMEKIAGAFGFGDSEETISEDRKSEAHRLTQEYATDLQAHLESRDRWQEIRQLAAANSE